MASEMLEAQTELEQCASRSGSFGKEVKRKQDSLDAALGKPPSSRKMGHVLFEIKRQVLSMKSDPVLSWKVTLAKSYPKL